MKRFQFSLRALFLFTIFVAVLCAFFLRPRVKVIEWPWSDMGGTGDESVPYLRYSAYRSLTGKLVRQGETVYWYRNGQVRCTLQYWRGSRHGRCVYWYEDGSQAGVEHYLYGKADGEWTWWHPNGQVWSRRAYIKGDLSGIWTFRDEDGRELGKGRWEFGRSYAGGLASFLHDGMTGDQVIHVLGSGYSLSFLGREWDDLIVSGSSAVKIRRMGGSTDGSGGVRGTSSDTMKE